MLTRSQPGGEVEICDGRFSKVHMVTNSLGHMLRYNLFRLPIWSLIMTKWKYVSLHMEKTCQESEIHRV